MAEQTGLRNNALPYPVYGVPYGVVFPLLDVDGDLVSGGGSDTPDSEISLNGDTFGDCTNELTEIATTSGMYYLLLTAAEMTADVVAIICKVATATTQTTPIVLYPRKLPQIRTGTAQAGAAGTITLDASASAIDDHYNGCLVYLNGGTGSGQARIVTDYAGSTKVASVTPNWATTPDATSTFIVYLPEGRWVVEANVKAVSDDATAADNLELATENAAAGYLAADLTHIHGTALTETAGQLAGRFVNFFDQAAATFNVATALADFKATGFSTHSAADVVTALGTGATLTAIPWNSTWDVEVESECNDALVALNLDHLVSTATGIPAVPAGTYLDQIMDDGTAAFDRTTDSLQAIRDTAPLGTAMRGTDSAALASVCTEARLAELDAANLPTDVANVKTDTAAILIDTAVIGAAGVGLTAIPWNAAWDAEVQSECADALTAYSASTLTAAQVNTEVDTALADINLDHFVGTATGIPALPAGTFLDQIVDDGTASFDRTTDSLQAIRDTAPLGTAMRGTDSAALASVCTEARLAELDAANLPTDVANVKTDTAAILVDTNELQTNQGNWLTATGFALASVCTEARLAELDAANLPTDVANVKTDTAAILLDTGTDGVVVVTLKDGAIGADVVADIFSTTTLTEAYAADGAAATPAQLLYLIFQALTEFAISSTTLTVKKLDGSTTAATYTLDSATAPTSRTRAS